MHQFIIKPEKGKRTKGAIKTTENVQHTGGSSFLIQAFDGDEIEII